MFSKAKRFENIPPKHEVKEQKKLENKPKSIQQSSIKTTPALKNCNNFKNLDTQSQCSSSKSVKSFLTPKPMNFFTTTKLPSSLKKKTLGNENVNKEVDNGKIKNEIICAQEVEIRNKDQTISEYLQQIDELKIEITKLQKEMKSDSKRNNNLDDLNKQVMKICINDTEVNNSNEVLDGHNENNCEELNSLKIKLCLLERHCHSLQQELCDKQVELSTFEEIIIIRDSLCKDLQEKLTNVENCLEETKQRLEMVKGHHALALEANESIRKEYKAELETLKLKVEEEKQVIINKSKLEQEDIKSKYMNEIDLIKLEHENEKRDIIKELQQKLITKENEIKAKLEQTEETTHEKLRLCEIQFEERCGSIQEHCSQQDEELKHLEKERRDLEYLLNIAEENKLNLQNDISYLKNENDCLHKEQLDLQKEIEKLKDDSKTKIIDFENEINKLTAEVEKLSKDKLKFEMSLSVTRDIVQVLTMRLRDSDNEVEILESKVQGLANGKETLENELASYKNTLNSTVIECNGYKEALVNILKSKAALAKEHTRIMEHNVTLIESLQNVEKEAYRELGSIKNELIDDVELLKKESNTQIKQLQEEVEKKRVLCELATEHAGQAAAAAEQSRALLAQAALELNRLETENHRLQQQIHDQQSLVVELSLLRQENEELTMTMATQNSIMEKMKKDYEQSQTKPKSPSVHKKTLKIGKENTQIIVSPLRERNY